MHLLITGGAGFIGSHLSDVLLERGYRVTCVDDLSKGRLANVEHNFANPRFAFRKLDIRRTKDLQSIARGCDVVVHLAASKIPRYESALSVLDINLGGARSAIEVARANSAKFVLASTSDVYGRNPRSPFDEDSDLVIGSSTSRRWAYAVTKLCDEHLAYAYRDEYDLDVTILRFFGTYGARQYLNWWGGPQGVFLSAIARGVPVEVHGDGRQTRSFIHISDLAEAVARATEREATRGEVVNIGRAEEVSITRLAELMYETSGKMGTPKITYLPYEQLPGNYQDVMRRVPSTEKMNALLDFVAEVDLETGLRSLWDWYWAAERPDQAL